MLARLGAIAQLGERVNGIHEVGSSILPGSTIFSNHSLFPGPTVPWRDTVLHQVFGCCGKPIYQKLVKFSSLAIIISKLVRSWLKLLLVDRYQD